ncbi:MAG: DUF6157 family protein [Fimbriimonas sp.]
MSYRDTFIAVSEDCPAQGEWPATKDDRPTAAAIQLRMLTEHPYRFTHDDVLFESSTLARTSPDAASETKAELRQTFFSRPQACLRASALPKRYGWGLHFDAEGKAAAYPAGSDEYTRLAADSSIVQTRGMRSKRKATT